MSDDEFPHDALVHCLDAAAEQMRAANHQTYTAREVTDLYAALGALHTLFSRFDQLAGYLLRTVEQADPVDFRHDDDESVALALGLAVDAIWHTAQLIRRATGSLAGAWTQLGHLALDIPDLVCPECGEPAHRGVPTDLTPMQRTAGIRPRYRHADGTQLCPVVGPDGYQPAPPHAPDSPSPITGPIHRDEPDPEGQH
jgi:hypothetical protein